MSRREEYEQKTEAILTPIVESRGFELVDVEYVKEAGTWYLRGYIDKPGGITVNDLSLIHIWQLLSDDPHEPDRLYVRSQFQRTECRRFRLVRHRRRGNRKWFRPQRNHLRYLYPGSKRELHRPGQHVCNPDGKKRYILSVSKRLFRGKQCGYESCFCNRRSSICRGFRKRRGSCQQYPGSVSYTHLDVDKRQVGPCGFYFPGAQQCGV